MISAEEKLIRSKIIGVLVRSARERAQKSVDQCAATLSCDPAFMVRAEEGRESLTLPQLESLALFLDVPLKTLLGKQEMPSEAPMSESTYFQNRMRLRRKIIGVLLRQARQNSGQTVEDLAAEIDFGPDDLTGIELGERPVSVPELQAIAEQLGVSMDTFTADGSGAPVPSSSAEASSASELEHLPTELREFIQQPMNAAYLQIALSLSQMPADALRRFASGLLEITY